MMYLDVRTGVTACKESLSDRCPASDPNYHKYEYLLSDGWVPGRKIVCKYMRKMDLADAN